MTRLRWFSRPVLAVSCAALLGPPRAVAADEFDFSSYETVPLVLTVRTADGAPLPHARVTVTDRWRRRATVHTQGRTFLTALTDDAGRPPRKSPGGPPQRR